MRCSPVHMNRNTVSGVISLLFVMALSFVLTGCVSNGASLNQNSSPSDVQVGSKSGDIRVVAFLPPPNGVLNSDNKIAASDVLEVDVFQVDQLDRTVEVSNTGTIQLPLIGIVKASGLTSRELERQVTAKYAANYLQNPQVSIFVKSSAARQATVDGEVNKAGLYPVTAQSSLSSILSQAGGLKKIADTSKVFVFRNVGKERQVANYSLDAIRNGTKADPRIYGSDVVVVFPSKGKVAMENLKDALGLARSAVSVTPLL